MEYSHELILPNEDIPFKLFLFEGKDGNYYRDKHWHGAVEIFALFEGKLNFYVNDEEYRLKAGDFMLVNSNEIHAIMSPEPNYTLVLQIPLSAFENYYTDDNFIYFSHGRKIQDEQVMKLIRSIYQVYQKREMAYELQVMSGFYELLYLLVTKYRKQDVALETIRNNRRLGRLSEITGYIKKHYAEEITLAGTAREFGYSPTYLSRMFQKYAGIGFKQYVDSVRLEHAYMDMMNSGDKIGEIALRSGFPNSNSFARQFLARYGMMPNEFRKRKRQEINIK